MAASSYAVILNGTSSAGKTSIARAMQRLSPTPVLHVSLDTFTDMFDWRSVLPADRVECHRIGVANFHATLPIIASSRFPLVIDHVFERREWYEACANALKSRPSYFGGVRCPLPILEAREKARGDRRAGMARAQFEAVHRGKQYALEVDTSVLSADQCAQAILEFVEHAGL